MEQALERGDVVKSQEVSTWFVIAGGALAIVGFSGHMASTLGTAMRGLLANSFQIRTDAPTLPDLFEKIGIELLSALAIPFLLLMLAAIAGNMVQHKLVWSFEALTPKLSKISLAAGFKRLFSMQTVINLLKGLVKVIVIGAVLIALM